jgi:hypothetical protein
MSEKQNRETTRGRCRYILVITAPSAYAIDDKASLVSIDDGVGSENKCYNPNHDT